MILVELKVQIAAALTARLQQPCHRPLLQFSIHITVSLVDSFADAMKTRHVLYVERIERYLGMEG